MNTEKGSTAVEPITIPVVVDVKRKRGADPIDAIENAEVRAFLLVERAFAGLDEGGKRRLAYVVADKYGPLPYTSLSGRDTSER